jgi:hypothetical protein
MTKPKLKIQKAPKSYKISPEKLSELPQRVFALVMCDTMYFSEDYKYFDVIKPYLDIPPEPKSLEELKQELDEKFEELLVKTKRKFAVSKESAEYHYNQFCKKQDGDFEYAKTNKFFPISLTTSGTIGLSGSYLIANGSGAASWSSNYVLRPDNSGVGFWSIDPNIQVWRKTKPNWLVRKCAKIFFDFTWKDAN